MFLRFSTGGRPEAAESGLTSELKFVGDETLAPAALALLDADCWPDPQHPAGQIHSVYFDTPDRRFHAEKTDGDNLKRKVRIRWYERPEADAAGETTVFVELKLRIGSARRKHRLAVPAPTRWLRTAPLDDPAWPAFLYRHAGALPEAIPLHLAPALCIRYARDRYVCPRTGSRIAVDRDIRAERLNPELLPGAPRVHLDRSLCEFKNRGGVLPALGEALFAAGFRLRSFSKYGECMNQALNGGTPA